MKKNYQIISCLLAFSGIALILVSRRSEGQTRSVFGFLGLALIFAFLVQMVLFALKPQLFKDKSSQSK